jgi:hypothetical protein
LEDGFRFTGSGTSYLQGSQILYNLNCTACTIEIVLKSSINYNTWAPVAMFGDWDGQERIQQIGVVALYSSHT